MQSTTSDMNVPTPSTLISKYERFVPLVVFVLAVVLLFFRIDITPGSFYDEGAHLHVAKNFAVNGVYADYSSEGNRPYGPSLGTGPTVLMLIGLAYRVFGVSIPLARLIIALYSLATFLLLYYLGRCLVNWKVGILAVILMMLSPGLEMWLFARSALGEMPGMFFVFGGLLLWFMTGDHQRIRLVGVGMLFGLASITKNQYALVVLPALLLCWVVNMVWYRLRKWSYFVIPGVVAGLIYFSWLYAIMFLISQPDSTANIEAIRGTSSYALFVWQIGDAIKFLLSLKVYGALFLPAVVFAVYVSRTRDDIGFRWGLLMVFVLMGILFYISSLAWPRYAFLALTLGALPVAYLFYQLSNQLQPEWSALLRWLSGGHPFKSSLNVAVMLFLLFLVARSVQYTVSQLRSNSMETVYETAAFLNENLPKDVTIETWEQDFTVLTDHKYHFPPQFVDAELGKEDVLGIPSDARERYDFTAYSDASYVIVGPIGEYSRLYPTERLTNFTLLKTIGDYHIYRKG